MANIISTLNESFRVAQYLLNNGSQVYRLLLEDRVRD